MKCLKYFLTAIIFLFISYSHAQVSVNVNIWATPEWGPAGYNDVLIIIYQALNVLWRSVPQIIFTSVMADGSETDSYRLSVETMTFTMDIKLY